jgi:hypothetical protein
VRRNGKEQRPLLRARCPDESSSRIGSRMWQKHLRYRKVKTGKLRMNCIVSTFQCTAIEGPFDEHLVESNAHLASPTCMILSWMSEIHFGYSSGFLAVVGLLRNEDSFEW